MNTRDESLDCIRVCKGIRHGYLLAAFGLNDSLGREYQTQRHFNIARKSFGVAIDTIVLQRYEIPNFDLQYRTIATCKISLLTYLSGVN